MKKKNFEYKTRLNAIVIYIIVLLICISMFNYFYTLKNNIAYQKDHVEKYKINFSLANEFIYEVNQAQSMGNMYISTKDSIYFQLFNKTLRNINKLNDSIKRYKDTDFEKSMLDSVYMLLKKKGIIISSLSEQFKFTNPVSLERKLENIRKTAFKSRGNMLDTIITTSQRKKLSERIHNVFFPEEEAVSTKIISTDSDTVKVFDTKADDDIYYNINFITAQISQKYTDHLLKIEKDISKLIAADYEISIQISDLLIKLHRQMIDFSAEEIKNNEVFIKKNYKSSLIAGGFSLAFILILVILIIKNSNKSLSLRKALEIANANTNAIMESRHQLLLSVSHDIKTPLNAILGYLELWNTENYKISQKEINAVQNSGKHIELLLENLLEFSRIRQGKIDVNYSDFNINKLFNEVAEMFEPLVLQKKLSFSHNTSINNNVVLHSDYLKTKQIISNILSNAIKYTTKGNISFNISYQNDLLNIEITDTGAGIPQDKIHSIYDAFSRVEENNVLSKGSGFGLYIVKNFVNILQGEISTVSTVGKGTSIKITIPAKSVIVAIKDMPCHIAIIDDDIPFLTMLKEMLSLMGHHVNTCTSLEELEDLLKAQDYDFLLTDMEMGTFTGKDVLKTVKSKAFTIPVIVISGRSDFNKEKTSEIGFDGYLQKPVTMESLQQFFCNVCSSHSGSGKIHELLNVDIEAAKKIWALFIESTVENIALLEQAVETNDFKKAKSICHKMQPMFLQLHFDNAAIILRKIDIAQESNFKWQDDIAALIDICKKVIQQENIVF